LNEAKITVPVASKKPAYRSGYVSEYTDHGHKEMWD